MRVKVYKNLHKNCYSVRALEGPHKGLVIHHATSLVLSNVRFNVGQKGRERVLRERQKNVHAFVVGTLEAIDLYKGYTDTYPFYKTLDIPCLRNLQPVSYNPYKLPYFYFKEDDSEVKESSVCILNPNGMWC